MKLTKKLLAFALVLAMVLSMVACSSDTTTETTAAADESGDTTATEAAETTASVPNRVILGSTTELSGDFHQPGWGGSSAGAADQDIWRLTVGYATLESDQGGAYVWNETAVASHSETDNDDGSRTYTVTINEGLTFSDGTPITAANYLAYPLLASSPVGVAAGFPGTDGQSLVGYADFNAYTGEEGSGSKVFSGIRLVDEYTFSLTVAAEYASYYFAYLYANLSPYPLEMWLGTDAEILDDGEGCYLSDAFYAKDSADDYTVATAVVNGRYDWDAFAFSGPYVISAWDEGTKEATLTLNPEFKGNFEGQTPSIETIVYVKIIEETQVEQLTTGAVDVLSAITGGDLTKQALEVVDGENFAETHYQRAGYGKIEFECDFGPTSFQEVRQAIAYLLNRTEFCQAFTGGYGVVVDGPYSPDFSMYQAVQDDIELIDYSYSLENAIAVLEAGGWIYNSKGEPYEAGQTGVDSVRYKKLTEEEANALDIYGNDAGNKTYSSVANTDNIVYQTVEIDGEYYMPLAINWFGSTPNSVTDLLSTTLANSTDLAAAGMVIRATSGDFTTLLGNIYRDSSMGYTGTPTYGMLNLANSWTSAVYDQAYYWSTDTAYADYSSVKLRDPYDYDFPYDITAEKLTYEEAVEASGDKLGMDYLSMAMVYNSTTEDEYNQWWMAFIERWNELMPEIPLYSNYYYDVYNANIENFETSPFFGCARAILYANIKGY